jgi:hypothetical protein
MIKKIIDEHGGLLSVITILLIFIAFFVIRKNKMNKEGVFTIAKVIKYESDASGGSLYIEVYFRGEKINTIVNSSCFGCDKDNDFYFVQLLKQNPKYDIYFFEDYPVPDCILKKPIPELGWKELPKCD